MSKGSVWKNTPEGKTIRRNKISEQFAWMGISMLESPAYRALSLSGHRVLARINIEHAHHGGQENGKLPVTFRDFCEYGVCMDAVGPAIREVEALGFIRVTEEGRAANGECRQPNKFALTHLPTKDNPKPTEDWKRIKTIEEAEMIAKAARNAVPKKQNTARINQSSTARINQSKNSNSCSDKPEHCPLGETRALSISRAVARPTPDPVLPLSSRPKLVWSTPVGSDKDELLKVLVVPEPMPRKLRLVQ
jgi:hypothetical protein